MGLFNSFFLGGGSFWLRQLWIFSLGLKFLIFSTFYDVFQEKISFLIRAIFQKLKKKETQQIKKNAFPTIVLHISQFQNYTKHCQL